MAYRGPLVFLSLCGMLLLATLPMAAQIPPPESVVSSDRSAEYWLTKAAQYEAQGYYGLALLCYGMPGVARSEEDLVSLCRTARSRLSAESTTELHVTVTASPESDSYVTQVSQLLLTALQGAAPDDITARPSGDTPRESTSQGRPAALSALVHLEGLGTSSERVGVDKRRVEYKQGEEQQVNPRYVELRDRIALLRAEVQDLRAELADLDAKLGSGPDGSMTWAANRILQYATQNSLDDKEERLRAAESEFQQTSAYQTRTFTGSWDYQVERHVKIASLELEAQLTDGTTVVWRERVRASSEDEDGTVVNPNPDLGVDPDPLELASDEELYLDALLPGVATAAEKLLMAAQAWVSDRQYSEAGMALAGGSQEAKLEGLARYLLLAPYGRGAKATSARAQLTAALGACPESFSGPLSLWDRGIGAFPAPASVRPLGLYMLDLTPGVAALTGRPAGGVYVLRVTNGSVAESAGIRPRDVIATADQRPVRSAADLAGAVGGSCYAPMRLDVERRGQRLSLDLRKGGDEGRIGAYLWPVTKHIAEVYGLKGGVLVLAADPKSPAEEAGLQVGDLILALDDIPVSGTERLVELICRTLPGSQMTVTVSRRGETMDLPVTVGAASRWTEEQTRLRAERDSVVGSPGPFGLPRDQIGEVQWEVTEGIPQSLASRAGLTPSDGLYVASSRLRGAPNTNRWNLAYPREGDVVLSVNGKKVTSLKQYEQLTDGGTARYWFFIPEQETGKAYLFKLWRDGYEYLVVLQR